EALMQVSRTVRGQAQLRMARERYSQRICRNRGAEFPVRSSPRMSRPTSGRASARLGPGCFARGAATGLFGFGNRHVRLWEHRGTASPHGAANGRGMVM